MKDNSRKIDEKKIVLKTNRKSKKSYEKSKRIRGENRDII